MKKSLYKKGLVLGIIALFVGASVIPSIGVTIVERHGSQDYKTSFRGFNPLGDILYVGGSGPGNYSSIQDAIDNASDGDTVFVYDDSSPYYEHVVINKKINLIGADRNTTVIDGKNGIVIKIYANGVYISGFIIRKGYHGIDIRSEYNIIKNNTIIFNQNGIRNRYSNGNNIITGNDISINSIGIVIWYSDLNIISDNTISENGRGVDLYYSSNNTISGNNVIYNEQEGVCLYDDTDDNIISSNFISNNGMYGISSYESNSNRNIIRDNTISLNYERGIQLWDSSNNIVTGNDIIKNGFALLESSSGIYLQDSNNNTITGNNLRLNFRFGIYFKDSSNNTISGNNFLFNLLNAFFTGYCRNTWRQNYWNRPRILPKLIFGLRNVGNWTDLIWIPCLPNIDWHPAKVPYDI